MKKYTTTTPPDEKVDHQAQRKRLEKLAALYEELDKQLDELETKIENSPNISDPSRKPR